MEENAEVFMDGIRQMYSAFLRRPTSVLLFDLMGYGRQLGSSDLLRRLEPYLTPEMLGPVSGERQ
jgi:hypothetical protein